MPKSSAASPPMNDHPQRPQSNRDGEQAHQQRSYRPQPNKDNYKPTENNYASSHALDRHGPRSLEAPPPLKSSLPQKSNGNQGKKRALSFDRGGYYNPTPPYTQLQGPSTQTENTAGDDAPSSSPYSTPAFGSTPAGDISRPVVPGTSSSSTAKVHSLSSAVIKGKFTHFYGNDPSKAGDTSRPEAESSGSRRSIRKSPLSLEHGNERGRSTISSQSERMRVLGPPPEAGRRHPSRSSRASRTANNEFKHDSSQPGTAGSSVVAQVDHQETDWNPMDDDDAGHGNGSFSPFSSDHHSSKRPRPRSPHSLTASLSKPSTPAQKNSATSTTIDTPSYRYSTGQSAMLTDHVAQPATPIPGVGTHNQDRQPHSASVPSGWSSRPSTGHKSATQSPGNVMRQYAAVVTQRRMQTEAMNRLRAESESDQSEGEPDEDFVVDVQEDDVVDVQEDDEEEDGDYEEEEGALNPSIEARQMRDIDARQAEKEEKDRKQQEIAEYLVHSLTARRGCTNAQHMRISTDHERKVAQDNIDSPNTSDNHNHNSISSTYTQARILHEPVSKLSPGIWSEQKVEPRGETPFPACSATKLSRDMEGSPEMQHKHICLHVDHVTTTKPDQIWDIDSWLLILSSFADLKGGFNCQRTASQPNLVNTDLHIKTKLFKENGAPTQAQPRHIPHLFLGSRPVNKYKTEMHIFFPNMYNPNPKGNFPGLEDAVIAEFFDRVFWPSLRLRSDQQHHHAVNHDTSKDKARAGVYENNNTARMGQMMNFDVPIPGENCKELDKRMTEIIKDNAHLAGFRDFYVLVGAKNVKEHYKEPTSLSECMEEFETEISAEFEVDKVESLYVDIGQEIIAPQHPGFNSDTNFDNTPKSVVYLHKTCCLESIYQEFKKEIFTTREGDIRNGDRQMFNHAYLRDASSMTIAPPSKSHAFRSGLRYSQWYNVYKEIFDAQKVFPFNHKNFTELAKGAFSHNHVARQNSGNTSRFQALEQSYAHSKKRTRKALVSSSHMPYGIRMEHRVSWTLFQKMKACAKDQSLPPTDDQISGSRTPTFVWAIPTRKFFSFLAGNYDKFARAFEANCRTSTRYISKDRARVNWVILKAMSQLQSTNIRRHPALAVDERPAPTPDAIERASRKRHNKGGKVVIDPRRQANHGEFEHGMGMEVTMNKYGFAWFLPRINWATFRFYPEYQSTFLAWYMDSQKGRGGHENIARDAMDAIANYGELLSRSYGRNPNQRIWLENLMMHAVFRQYRHDVAVHFSRTNNHKLYDPSIMDSNSRGIRFSWKGIQEAISGPHMFVSPKGKVNAIYQHELIEWLFGGENEETSYIWREGVIKKLKRKSFKQSAFRDAYHFARRQVVPNGGNLAHFEADFEYCFFMYHWVVPYPDTNGVLSSTHKEHGQARRWFHTDPNGNSIYTGAPRPGYPQDDHVLKMLSWDSDRVESELRRVSRA